MKSFFANTQTTIARSNSAFDSSVFTVLKPFSLPDTFAPDKHVTVLVLPPGESLSAIRASAESALDQCKMNHRNNGGKGLYNMNIANVCVSSVGLEISEDGDTSFCVEISDANCDTLARHMYAIMCQDSDIHVTVMSSW